jgi:hypothetical protein
MFISRIVIAALCFAGIHAFADSPEVYTVSSRTSISKVAGGNVVSKFDSLPDSISVTISDCVTQSDKSVDCKGTTDVTKTIDNYTFTFRLIVNKYMEANGNSSYAVISSVINPGETGGTMAIVNPANAMVTDTSSLLGNLMMPSADVVYVGVMQIGPPSVRLAPMNLTSVLQHLVR